MALLQYIHGILRIFALLHFWKKFYLLTLGDELRSVELCDDRLEDFVADGGQDLFVKVFAELSVNLWNLEHVRPRKDTQADVDLWILSIFDIDLCLLLRRTHQDSMHYHLQVLGSGRRSDLPRPRPNVVNDGVLEPRDSEVETLCHDVGLDSAQATEDDSSVTTIDCANIKEIPQMMNFPGYLQILTIWVTQFIWSFSFPPKKDFSKIRKVSWGSLKATLLLATADNILPSARNSDWVTELTEYSTNDVVKVWFPSRYFK